MLRRTLALAAAAGLTLGAAAAAQAAEINLKLSHFLPPVHGIHTDFIEPWAHDLEACSNGKVHVDIYPGGTQLGNVAKQQEQVLAGVVDIAHGLTGIPRGRFPRTSVIDLPFLTESADAATRTLWKLYPEYLKPEYKGLHVLALHAHNGGLIHTRDKQVKTMDDLKGLRIRTPSPAISMMLEALGAVPQGMPPGQVYEALQKGVIDGTVFPWDPVKSFRLAEVLKYHLDARVYTVSFFFVMNQKRYDSLPDDVRACVDKLSGDNLIPKFGPWWDKWDAPGKAAAEERGNVITKLSDAERARWREALQPMIDAYLKQLEDQGVENAREIYAKAQAYTAEFEKK
ncbi:TRAP-type C4-dicarboxylate transport system, substrate-binding protein [Tistlia consotensis]|uniref:TRAP-type C4-dicarboxylate transport system, substrate-binding protein n=1 Tax=Tistlia consotensis USBA 355 TaxID=560819 RepID=A0A1Y6BJT8_9PROT|nr:TRAP transporter substrate-binding protein [Tistlia consotensis]SMF13355.1 TRAP-type C4-dicarboxylate transport system, substrate-binding protein [Tistlia consotensis USBA 355]SNR50565.1 TRAP-type C4-dicarboxylate transport system, substrate-binding protein [Tistlia consotensis]